MNQKIQSAGIIKHILSFLTLLLFLLFSGHVRANMPTPAKKSKTRMKVEYFKKGDDSKQIKVSLSSKIKRKRVAIQNVSLSLFDETDSLQLVGTATTDKKGIAVFSLPRDYPVGKEGDPSTFVIRFDGNNNYKPALKSLKVKDVKLEVTYKVIDSVYTVNVSAFEWTNGKAGNPVSDVDVYVYVKRLFSLLKVGEGWLQDGKAVVEIPNDLPGDLNQNLKFVTMIPETDDYGTVESNKTMKWGKPIPLQNKYANEQMRALWEPRAPIWMVITLGVLLLGVFYHYFLIGFKLYKIKKIGKKESVYNNVNQNIISNKK